MESTQQETAVMLQRVLDAVDSEGLGPDHDSSDEYGNALDAAREHLDRLSKQEQGYNGWTNYETWAMALWIDNDKGTYRYSRELVAESGDVLGGPPEALRSWVVDEWMPDLSPYAGPWVDLLNAAIGEVDWYEIAENYLSEVSTDA